MSQAGSRGTIAALIFGGVTLLGLFSFLFYKWFTPAPPAITNAPEAKKAAPAATTASTKSVTVEDESDSDSEDEDEEDENLLTDGTAEEDNSEEALAKAEAAKQAAELKERYDGLVRMSTKLIQGNAHERAIENLTEAIALASSVPSAAKDVLTLYNNRSAMYEKTGQYDAALRDITIVLTMDARHVKAKLRRARIFEAQERLLEALEDYIYVMFLERMKGEQPSNDRKIQTLSKSVGVQKATKVLKTLRNASARALPAKAYIQTLLESFPAFFQWKQRFSGENQEEQKVALQQAVLESKTNSARENPAENRDLLAHSLELVRLELVQAHYEDAFALLQSLAQDVQDLEMDKNLDSESEELKSLFSALYTLQGLELHVKSQLDAATALYRQAMALDAQNLSAALLLCMVLLDLGETAAAEREFDALLAQYSFSPSPSNEKETSSECSLSVEDEELYARVQGHDGESVLSTHHTHSQNTHIAIARAWVLIHRTTLFISRDASGNHVANAIEKAMKDLDEVLVLTENCNAPEALGARFTALLKSVHVRTQTKAAMEQQPTEEDFVHNRENISEAKKIFPDHDVILQIEADQLSTDGEHDKALALVEKRGKDDLTGILVRASLLTAKAFMDMTNPSAMLLVQAQLGEVAALYTHALDIEPKAIEVMAQFAQLKSMILGDLQGSVELLERALALARSRDEVVEICQLLVMNEAQLHAVEKIQNGL